MESFIYTTGTYVYTCICMLLGRVSDVYKYCMVENFQKEKFCKIPIIFENMFPECLYVDGANQVPHAETTQCNLKLFRMLSGFTDSVLQK